MTFAQLIRIVFQGSELPLLQTTAISCSLFRTEDWVTCTGINQISVGRTKAVPLGQRLEQRVFRKKYLQIACLLVALNWAYTDKLFKAIFVYTQTINFPFSFTPMDFECLGLSVQRTMSDDHYLLHSISAVHILYILYTSFTLISFMGI